MYPKEVLMQMKAAMIRISDRWLKIDEWRKQQLRTYLNRRNKLASSATVKEGRKKGKTTKVSECRIIFLSEEKPLHII